MKLDYSNKADKRPEMVPYRALVWLASLARDLVISLWRISGRAIISLFGNQRKRYFCWRDFRNYFALAV
jgi:hypothetical protein